MSGARRPAFSRQPAGGRWPAGLLVASLALVAAVAGPLAAAAQSEPAEPPAAAFPAELGEPPRPTPFAGRLALEARALRGLRPAVAAQILGAPEGGDIALAALAMPLSGDGATVPVALFVEVDGASFLDANQARTARVELYAYVLGADDAVAGYLADVFLVPVDEIGEAIWQSGLKYFGRLEVPPGEYRLRVMVRNFQSGARGVEELPLTVPAPGGPRLLAPLFPEPARRDVWLPVRGWALGREAGDPSYPFVVAGRAVDPAARPVLGERRRLRAYLPARELGEGELAASLQILEDAAGEPRVAVESPLELSRGEVGPAGVELLAVTLEAPALEPGRHPFRVALERPGAAPIFSPVGSLLAVGPEIQDRDLVWSDVRWLLSAREAVAEVRQPRSRRKREKARLKETARRRRALADSYRRVLRERVTDSVESAGVALFEVEMASLGRAAGSGIQGLRETELAVAAELGRAGPEALMPIVSVHGGMYARYRSRHLFSLLAHTRSVLEGLAHLYAELGGRPETAAAILVSVGGHLQEANLPASSRRLFSAALAYDPDNAAALIGLATSFEKYGEYPQAIGRLEALVAAHPEFAEGRLRLAVNLGRVGLNQRARALLASVAEDGAAGWVQAVAYQELARGYLDSGDLRRAAEVLEGAIGELPDRPGLRFLLAHVYDRLGRPGASLRGLLGVAPAAAAEASERLRYDSWPQAVLERAREELEAAAAVALTTLAEALDTAQAAGAGGPTRRRVG